MTNVRILVNLLVTPRRNLIELARLRFTLPSRSLPPQGLADQFIEGVTLEVGEEFIHRVGGDGVLVKDQGEVPEKLLFLEAEEFEAPVLVLLPGRSAGHNRDADAALHSLLDRLGAPEHHRHLHVVGAYAVFIEILLDDLPCP